MNDKCPICLETLEEQKKTIGTMMMGRNYEYIVYSCEACEYVVDFTTQKSEIRATVVSAAFRRMAADLSKLHAGLKISKDSIVAYKRFVESHEFKTYAEVWEEKEFNFWEENKHLLIWIKP